MAAALVCFGSRSKVFVTGDVDVDAKQTSQLQKSSQPAMPKSMTDCSLTNMGTEKGNISFFLDPNDTYMLNSP